MAINHSQQGFALLVAVIFVSVMLAFALLIGTLGYKQSILANSAIDSQYAFYAADSALECILGLERVVGGDPGDPLGYDATGAPDLPCGEDVAAGSLDPYGLGNKPAIFTYQRVALSEKQCADVTVYKYQSADAQDKLAYFFAQGYSTSCDKVGEDKPYAVRGIQYFY